MRVSTTVRRGLRGRVPFGKVTARLRHLQASRILRRLPPTSINRWFLSRAAARSRRRRTPRTRDGEGLGRELRRRVTTLRRNESADCRDDASAYCPLPIDGPPQVASTWACLRTASPHDLHRLHDPSPATGSGTPVALEWVRGAASRQQECQAKNAAPLQCSQTMHSPRPQSIISCGRIPSAPPDRRARHHAGRLHGPNAPPTWPSACIAHPVKPDLSLTHYFRIHPEPSQGWPAPGSSRPLPRPT